MQQVQLVNAAYFCFEPSIHPSINIANSITQLIGVEVNVPSSGDIRQA